MTLQCTCGSYALTITTQSHPENGTAYESYECEDCGRTGSFTHDTTTARTTLSGSIRSDDE